MCSTGNSPTVANPAAQPIDPRQYGSARPWHKDANIGGRRLSRGAIAGVELSVAAYWLASGS